MDNLGAHYDTRIFSDQDPDPEKAHTACSRCKRWCIWRCCFVGIGTCFTRNLPGEIWLVFFDAEDNGDIPGWDWILGSQVICR